MNGIKKTLITFFLLNKRLLKKAGFLVMLLAVPVLVAAMTLSADDDAGLMKITLASEAPDTVSEKLFSEFLESEMISFQVMPSPDEAVAEVVAGRADAAWIFSENLSEKMYAFTKDPRPLNSFVRVVEREDNATLKIAREKLYSKVYSAYAYDVYIDFIRDNVEILDKMSDEEIKEYFDSFTMNDEMFTYEYYDSSDVPADDSAGYLVTPLRGLLAIMVVLVALSVAMYWLEDEKKGTFVWVPARLKVPFSIGYHLTAVFDVGIIVLLSILLSGMSVGAVREIIVMLCYILACAVFCILVRNITRKVKVLGTVTPILTVSLIVICPVFWDFATGSGFVLFRHLFPTTYYLEAVHNPWYIGYMLLYTAAVGLIDYLIYKIESYFKA